MEKSWKVDGIGLLTVFTQALLDDVVGCLRIRTYRRDSCGNLEVEL